MKICHEFDTEIKNLIFRKLMILEKKAIFVKNRHFGSKNAVSIPFTRQIINNVPQCYKNVIFGRK